MHLSADRWLTDVLGFEVFRVDDAVPLTAQACRAVEDHIRQRSKAMYYAKVDTCAVDGVEAWSRLGFNVVDVNLTFAGAPGAIASAVPLDARVGVSSSLDGDRAAVLDIAGRCFRYSRFHLDPHLTDEAAHHVKREWVASYFDLRRGDQLFVARLAGRIAGFLAAVKTDHDGLPAAVIDLIGVATDCQRSGVGRALVRRFAAHYARCDSVVVGTQAANVPSIRLYEGLGFRATRSAYVLHRHAGTGPA